MINRGKVIKVVFRKKYLLRCKVKEDFPNLCKVKVYQVRKSLRKAKCVWYFKWKLTLVKPKSFESHLVYNPIPQTDAHLRGQEMENATQWKELHWPKLCPWAGRRRSSNIWSTCSRSSRKRAASFCSRSSPIAKVIFSHNAVWSNPGWRWWVWILVPTWCL